MILPRGEILTFTQTSPSSVTANVLVADIKYRNDVVLFERPEFSNERLRQAKNTDGSVPIIQQLQGGRVYQFMPTCGSANTVRPLGPDDANVDNIFKRFVIKRYELTGLPSSPTEIDKLFAIAKDHRIRLARFEAHQAEARADVSYNFLISLQSDNFTYLTSTSLSMASLALGAANPETHMLITEFSPGVEYSVPNDAGGTSVTLIRNWSCVIENRIIQPADDPYP